MERGRFEGDLASTPQDMGERTFTIRITAQPHRGNSQRTKEPLQFFSAALVEGCFYWCLPRGLVTTSDHQPGQNRWEALTHRQLGRAMHPVHHPNRRPFLLTWVMSRGANSTWSWGSENLTQIPAHSLISTTPGSNEGKCRRGVTLSLQTDKITSLQRENLVPKTPRPDDWQPVCPTQRDTALDASGSLWQHPEEGSAHKLFPSGIVDGWHWTVGPLLKHSW